MAYWVLNEEYTTETRINADLVYENTGGSRRIYVYLDGELYNSNKYDVESYDPEYGADSLRYNFTGLDPGTCYEIEAIFEGSEAYPATDSFCTLDNSFIDPYIKSFGASPGWYNPNTGIMSFDMAVRVINNNDYSTTGTIQIIVDGQLFRWSGELPSGSNRVVEDLTIEVDVGKLSTGDYIDYRVDFSCNFYWINLDDGDTYGDSFSDFVYVDFTVEKDILYFNGKSPLTENLRGTSITASIKATQWNKFCEAIGGTASSYGGKSQGDIIPQTGVQALLNELDSSTTVGKECLIDYFIEIETKYNS